MRVARALRCNMLYAVPELHCVVCTALYLLGALGLIVLVELLIQSIMVRDAPNLVQSLLADLLAAAGR
jgi:uncharacterized protein YbcC (UPF0753/DUF2309 family)